MDFKILEEHDVTNYITYPASLTCFPESSVDASVTFHETHFPKPIPKDIRLSKQSIISSSMADEAEATSKIIKRVLHNLKTITDATASAGCNTINFSSHFSYVNAVEFDPLEYDRLDNNIKKYKLNNVSTYNQDYTRIIDTLSQDVVFIDAPQGGPKHFLLEKFVQCLSKIKIDDITNYILRHKLARLVVLKVPRNIWLNDLKYPYKRVDMYRNLSHLFSLIFVSDERFNKTENKIILRE
jgi:hypothetical protein